MIAVTIPVAAPSTTLNSNSFTRAFQFSFKEISLFASSRTKIDIVCVPALPPIPVTMVMVADKATTCSIVF